MEFNGKVYLQDSGEVNGKELGTDIDARYFIKTDYRA